MLVILTVLATALAAVWLILLFSVSEEDWKLAAINQILSNLDEIEKLRKKSVQNQEKLSAYQGLLQKLMGKFYETDFSKQTAKLQKANASLQNGDLGGVSLFTMPGYALQRRFPVLTQNSMYKNLVQNYTELKGKKYAIHRSKDLIAKIVSYLLIGIVVTLVVMVLLASLMGLAKGALYGALVLVIALVLVYAQYDEVADQLKKRRRAISRQFPNVVSKMALLATSGMIVSKAWKETAESQSEELYLEMRNTAEELDNLVNPEEAYMNFINRCNTKETTKLASAIIQNLSKGNAEIGRLLKELAKEAWVERQHTAKKDGEKANSMLMIPTMLLFISILIMIIAPALTGLSV